MKLFSEKVNPTFTSSTLNILTVKNSKEVFFDVYELEINGKTFTAEKIAEHNGNPVVNVPVVIGEEEFIAPFVLERGSFKIEFNKNNKEFVGSTKINLPDEPFVIQEEYKPVIDTKIEDLVIEQGKKSSRMIFDQTVEVSISNVDHNILVVENYDEVYFDIYEILINNKKYNAEKISTYKSRPVVNIPIVFENKEYIAPFVLEKGKQEVLFNESNLTFVKDIKEEEFILPIIEEEVVEDIVLEKKESILKDITNARKLAKEYAENIKLKKIEEANNVISNNEKKLKLYVEDVKDNLTNEFLSIVDKTNINLISKSETQKEDLTNYINNFLKEESKNLLENLENLNNDSIVIFENKIQDLVKNVYTKELTILINDKSDSNVARYSKIFNETKDSLEKLLTNNKSNIDKSLKSLKEEVDNSIITLEKSNVSLDDKINKGLNKALSRVGNLKVETLKEVDSKIELTENKITDIYEITLNDVRNELEKGEKDFSYVNEKIKDLTKKSNSIKSTTNEELGDIKSDIVKLKVEKGELEQRILESKELLEASVKKLTKLNKDIAQENKYYLQKEVDKLQEKTQLNKDIVEENKYYLQKEVDKLQERTQLYADKANKNNLKNDKEILTFKKNISKELNKTKEFLSKEVKSIDISLKEDLISNIDYKLEITNKEIDKILNERIEEVDSNFRQELTTKILESKTQLQEKVDQLKDSIPEVIEKEIIIEKGDSLPDKDFKLEISKLEKRIADRFTSEINAVRKYMDMYGGGGGSVAEQFGSGGEVSGNILPAENNTFNLGSADKRWKDLFISGDTIDIGGTKLKIVDNALRVEDADDNDASLGVENLSASNLILSGGRDLADIFATAAEAGINTVNAGAGLTGGGSATSVTINAGEGDGIDVSADSIAVDNTVLRTTGASAVGLSATATTNGFVSAGRDLAEIFAPTSTIINKGSGLSDYTVLDTFKTSDMTAGKYSIQVVNAGSGGGTYFSELSITTDGIVTALMEYGINHTTDEPFIEYGGIVNSGTVSLTARAINSFSITNCTFKGNRLNLFS